MSKEEKVAVFIDGSNLYFKLISKEVDLKNLSKFNYKEFVEYLSRDRNIVYLGYYVGVVRVKKGSKKGEELRKEQQRLFAHLQSKNQDFSIKKGYIMNNNGAFHEKGVDVELAVDLLVGAYENLYDTAILISSDTDLIPAIKKAKELGKKVEHVGFSNQPSFALQRYASLSKLLSKEDVEQFEDKTLL